ncbi:MAG: ABC transporter permease [Lautropia sp.]
MLRLVVRRLFWAAPLVIAVTFSVFVLLALAPGDIAVTIAGENGTLEQIAEIRKSLGLDEPLIPRYWTWLTAALHGNLGDSLVQRASVASLIENGIGATASLVIVAMIIGLLIGVPAGISAALSSGSRIADRAVALFVSLLVAVPSFWVGLMLVVVISLGAGWLPATGYAPLSGGVLNWLKHVLLPALALSTIVAAEITRQLRASMVDVMKLDYITTARAKGLPSWKIVGKHALKNAAIPTVTVAGFRMIELVGSAIAVERVFNIHGMASLMGESVLIQDIPVVLGIVLVTSLFVVLINLAVDLSYGYLNPRTRS